MSFPVEFAAGVKPNDRSELSSGLDFSRHPTSVYRSTDIVSEQLPSLSQLSDVSALARRGVDVGDTIRSEEVDKGKSEEAYGDIAPKRNIITITGYLHDDLDDYVPYEEILQEALKEERFYTDQLEQLQGTVVPKYYGLYTCGEEDRYIAMILENAGQSLGSRYLIIPEEWQIKIYEAYKRIHLQGILHHDLDGRHILIQGGEVRLVGFRRSYGQDVKNPAHVKRLLTEASTVRGAFGFRSGAELSLNNASLDYWAALPDPAEFKDMLDRAVQRWGWHPPEIRAINVRRGMKYTEDGFEIGARR